MLKWIKRFFGLDYSDAPVADVTPVVYEAATPVEAVAETKAKKPRKPAAKKAAPKKAAKKK